MTRGRLPIRRRRVVGAAPAELCCALHGRNCEPPWELCCEECTEEHHGMHTDVPGGPVLSSHHDGSVCSNPDLSGSQ